MPGLPRLPHPPGWGFGSAGPLPLDEGWSPGTLDEASLSRLWRHTEDPFAIITAFRDKYSLKQNRDRNRQLLSTLNSMGMGPILLTGHWAEAPPGMDYQTAKQQGATTDVEEDAFFVPKPHDMDPEEFRLQMTLAMKMYDQDAIVFSDDEATYLLFNDSSRSKFDNKRPTFNKVNQAYSNLRKKPSVPFVFEGTRQPGNIMGRMAFDKIGLAWVPNYQPLKEALGKDG